MATTAHSTEFEDISLNELLQILWNRWRVIALAVVLFTVAAAAAAFMMRPVYLAEVLLAPVEDPQAGSSLGALANQFGGLASLAGVNIGTAGTEKEEAIAILNSRRFATDFIRDNNLKPLLFEDDWDADAEAWRQADAAEQPSDWDAFRVFDEEVRRVVVDRGTGLVTLQVRWHDPAVAQRWANQLVRRANDAIRADAIEESNRSIEYLERELENTSVVELRNGLFQLIEKQISTVMLANVRDEYAFKVLDPAVAADIDEFESPKRLVIIAAGVLLGLVAGIILVFLMQFVSARSQPSLQ